MSCGLPVVTTPVGGIAEAVEHGRTGLVIEPRQVEPLAGALANLLANAALRERLGQAARREAERRFGIAPMLDRMEHIFLDAANRG
jgi:glycosyltransferase involved in cell wall biosynthesis